MVAAPTLLLVEDNSDDVALAQRALLKCGAVVRLEVARSGREAWGLLKTQLPERPRAILLDLNMPEWDGFEFLQRLRADDDMRKLPVVVLTTSREPADIERSYALGANSFVTKPVDFMEFSDVFSRVMRYWTGVNEVV